MDCDILIIGAGISGAAAAYAIGGSRRVIMLEGEFQPGYHATGRSAALYEPALGTVTVQRFNAASGSFLRSPLLGFADRPLMTRRGGLTIADAEGRPALDRLLKLDVPSGHAVQELTAEAAVAMVPILRRDLVHWAALEPGVMDMDVHAIHQGYLRGFASAGGKLVCDAPVKRIERRNGLWETEAAGQSFRAPIVVNAAGAWADEVARSAGLSPLGLQAKRRTVVILPAPDGLDTREWPVTTFAGEAGYLKPEAGKLLVSPGDATPVEPQDIQPEELDVALLVDWFENKTTMSVKRVERQWAGLRTFASDDSPVLGEDPDAAGFHWLAGQGGCGIMMSESLGRSLASLLLRGELPADIRALGVDPADISPRRLRVDNSLRIRRGATTSSPSE
jgi:D-arginine dehydrogenase